MTSLADLSELRAAVSRWRFSENRQSLWIELQSPEISSVIASVCSNINFVDSEIASTSAASWQNQIGPGFLYLSLVFHTLISCLRAQKGLDQSPTFSDLTTSYVLVYPVLGCESSMPKIGTAPTLHLSTAQVTCLTAMQSPVKFCSIKTPAAKPHVDPRLQSNAEGCPLLPWYPKKWVTGAKAPLYVPSFFLFSSSF